MGIPWWKSTLFFVIIIIASMLLFPTQRERGFLYWKSGIFDKAQLFLASRHKLAPEDLANAIRYLESLSYYGKYDLWKREAFKLIIPHSDSMTLHKHMAEVYEDNLEPIKAVVHLEALMWLGDKRKEIRYQFISLCQLTDQYKQLIGFYEEELKQGLADRDTYYALAKIYSRQRKDREAEGVLLKLLKDFPNEVKAKLQLIGIYEYRGHMNKAFRIYEDLINKKLVDVDFILRYVNHLFQKKEIIKSSEVLEKASVDFPESFTLKETLANTYFQLGEKKKAVKLYEQCYQQNSQNDRIVLSLANIYADLKDYKKATECLEKYHEKNQGDYRSHHLLGDMRAALGNTDASQREYEKALKLLRINSGK